MRHLVLVVPGRSRSGRSRRRVPFRPGPPGPPVLAPGATPRELYLAAGDWVDLWRAGRRTPPRAASCWRGEPIPGGRALTCRATRRVAARRACRSGDSVAAAGRRHARRLWRPRAGFRAAGRPARSAGAARLPARPERSGVQSPRAPPRLWRDPVAGSWRSAGRAAGRTTSRPSLSDARVSVRPLRRRLERTGARCRRLAVG